jgi:predicted transcriptional regulator
LEIKNKNHVKYDILNELNILKEKMSVFDKFMKNNEFGIYESNNLFNGELNKIKEKMILNDKNIKNIDNLINKIN